MGMCVSILLTCKTTTMGILYDKQILALRFKNRKYNHNYHFLIKRLPRSSNGLIDQHLLELLQSMQYTKNIKVQNYYFCCCYRLLSFYVTKSNEMTIAKIGYGKHKITLFIQKQTSLRISK
jgi:hypothetical protein